MKEQTFYNFQLHHLRSMTREKGMGTHNIIVNGCNDVKVRIEGNNIYIDSVYPDKKPEEKKENNTPEDKQNRICNQMAQYGISRDSFLRQCFESAERRKQGMPPSRSCIKDEKQDYMDWPDTDLSRMYPPAIPPHYFQTSGLNRNKRIKKKDELILEILSKSFELGFKNVKSICKVILSNKGFRKEIKRQLGLKPNNKKAKMIEQRLSDIEKRRMLEDEITDAYQEEMKMIGLEDEVFDPIPIPSYDEFKRDYLEKLKNGKLKENKKDSYKSFYQYITHTVSLDEDTKCISDLVDKQIAEFSKDKWELLGVRIKSSTSVEIIARRPWDVSEPYFRTNSNI